MGELKSCPICGERPTPLVTISWPIGFRYVCCKISCCDCSSWQDAEIAWNKAVDDESAELLDRLRPKGRWVDKKNENVWCSVCQCHPLKDMDKDSVYYWKYEPDFCPNCGADMRGGGEDA